MGSRFDLLVFDWDGTLVDSAAHIVASIQKACRDLELPVPSDAAARQVIGLGLHDALAQVLPGIDESRYGDVAERYRIHFLAGDAALQPYPQVQEGIMKLQVNGYLLAVATGKSRRGLDRALQSFEFGTRFAATRCADEGFPKPHPDMLEWLAAALGVRRERTLMIGDTTHDLQMAANARVSAVAVSYGAHSRALLEAHSPLACADSFGELLAWLDT
ncbi:MAG: HAD-IA family hydrolase, partial [Burkholderiales bacterium]